MAQAAEFLSDIVSGFDLHKPEISSKLRRPFGKQFAGHFMNLREWMFFKAVAQETYGHFELSRFHDSFIVAADVAAPVGQADITVVIDTDSLTSDNKFYPRKWDTVFFPNEVTGQIIDIDVTTPTAPELTIRINSSTKTFGALSEGDTLVIISSAFAEKSGQPESALSGVDYHDNDIQIIKETVGVSGSEMTNQSWLDINGDGNAPYYWIGQEQLDYRMALKIDGAITFQDRTTNLNMIDPETGTRVMTTEGVYPYARRRANPYPVAAGAFDIDDFDAIDLIMEATDSGNFNCVLSGATRYQNIENVLKTYHDDTNINYARQVVNEELYGGAMSQDSSINFKVFTKSSRTNLLKRNHSFSNPTTYGAAGYDMKDWALFYPLNKTIDPKDNSEYESMGYRYKELGGYNRMMEVWSIGGAGQGQKLTEYDKKDLFQRANIGAHNANGQQWVFCTPP